MSIRKPQAFALALLCATLAWIAYANYYLPNKRYPPDHVIHVTAKLTFDDKPVVIDDYIDCLAETRGTPTSSPHLAFQLGRLLVAAKIKGGGMIVIPVSRSWCFAMGSIWGSALPELTVPDGWLPVIFWYDARDLRQASEGLAYLSEEAVFAENSRLKVIEGFRLSIPEHPATKELIDLAQQQSIDRSLWKDTEPTLQEGGSLLRFVGSMIAVEESEWREGREAGEDAARIDTPVKELLNESLGAKLGPDASGLFPISDRDGKENAELDHFIWSVYSAARRGGRGPSIAGLMELGVPRLNKERFGLLISNKGFLPYSRGDRFPTLYGTRIPWTCIDGVISPDFDHPGLLHWNWDRCLHLDNFKGYSWQGIEFEDEWAPALDHFLIDLSNNSVWQFHLDM